MPHRRRAAALALLSLCIGLGVPSGAGAVTRRSSQAITARSATDLLRWSDPATWGGRVPSAGSDVTVPAGTRVLLDVSPPSLGGLQIDGALTFARSDLELTARWIVVHGSLRVGTAKNPFTQRATITLTDDARRTDVMGMGTKLLGVMGGKLDLHGARVTSWTRLDATAERGSRELTLETEPGWGAGDRIVIASSDYWRTHDEERTITRVSGRTVQLDKPLEYRHWGTLQTIAGRTLDERAEIGLLSRNIVVRGDDPGEDGFGAHTMIMEGGRARIEGVEFANGGQAMRLRRYPVHFHMEGDAHGSYLKNSSIHHSFNRCVTVHGTRRLVVEGNVCYSHPGHGFFLEDGAETDNVIVGNLGLGTRKLEEGLLPSDDHAATFWITNPDNIVKNNVAAGSDSIGFWYALPEHPTGLSRADSMWPQRTPLGVFDGNVAHSNGNRGLEVDHGPQPNGVTHARATWYRPVADPTDEDSEPVVARFENFTAYMNRDRGIWLRGENHVVSGAILADNRAGATFASEESFLQDSLVIGESANQGMAESWEKTGPGGRALPLFWEPGAPIVGFEFYDGRVGVSRTTFAGFTSNSGRRSGALGYLAPNAFGIHPKNFASDVSFVDSNPVYLAPPEPGMDGDMSKVFIDEDGSVTGKAGRAVVVDNPFLLNNSCAFRAEWNAHVCDADYVSLMTGSDGNVAAVRPVVLTRQDGVRQELFGCCDDSDDAWTSVLADRAYRVDFAGRTPSEFEFVLWRGRGRWVEVKVPVQSKPRVTRWGYPIREVAGASGLSSSESAYYYDEGNNMLHLRIVGNRYDWEEIDVELR